MDMNIWDILILAAVGIALLLAIRAIRRKKSGGCSCGCEGCPGSGSCNSRQSHHHPPD